MSKLFDDASLAMIPSAYKDGKLYSIRPTDGSGDFTFSRGTTATRVDVNGLIEKGRENSLRNSNTFNSIWSISVASITGGQAGYDGSNDAWLLSKTGNAYGSIYQTNTLSTGVFNVSVYMKAGTNNKGSIRLSTGGANDIRRQVNLTTGAIAAASASTSNPISESATDVGGGWWRFSFCGNMVTSTITINIYAGDTADTTGNIYIQDAQIEAGLVATDYIETGASTAQAGILEDMPRLDYSGGASCPALLLEPQRSNLVTQSEYLNGYFINVRSSNESNALTSPEGVQNATKLLQDSATTNAGVLVKSITASGTNTFSFFAKKGSVDFARISLNSSVETSAYFDLENGEVGTTYSISESDCFIEDYGNGWYRCGATYSGAINRYNIYLGDADNSTFLSDASNAYIYIYGAQWEASSSYPTSYIPTYGASVTRSDDDCVSSNIDGLIGDNQGTLFVQGFGQYRTGADNHLISLSSLAGGNGTDRILIYTNNTNGNLQVYIDNGGSAQYGAPINLGVQGSDANDKIAVAFADNDLSVYVNGSKVASSTSGIAPTMFYLSFNEWVSNHQNTSEYKQAAIFPTRLTDAELAALTA